jgi:hypothetical protein
MGDARLAFPEMSFAWKAGTKQHLLGSDYIIYDPIKPFDDQPTTVEFEIISNQTLLFGPNTKFNFKLSIQEKESATTGEWKDAKAVDNAESVVMQPNWMGHLIKEIAVFHANNKLYTTDEARYISPYLDTFLYHYMDELGKKLLCPQPCHPGNGTPKQIGSWLYNADGKDWADYAKTVMTGKEISFDYIPLHLFPFFQRANFLVDNSFPSPLPMTPVIDKLLVRMSFTDKFDNIFKKKAGNNKLYRVVINSVKLLVEQARLSSSFERSLYAKKNLLPYAGVTKIMIAESIGATLLTHRARFQNVAFPEGLFVFALPQKCISGTYPYSENVDGNVFSPHNIEAIQLTYNGQSFYTKDPNISMVEDNYMEVKQMIDHLASPPFGVTMDQKRVSLYSIKSGAKNTPYPHVYLNLCNFGDKTRLVPLLNDGSVLSQNHDLDIIVNFKTGGATANVTYFFYLFYTDTNMILDLKNKKFYSPYLNK